MFIITIAEIKVFNKKITTFIENHLFEKENNAQTMFEKWTEELKTKQKMLSFEENEDFSPKYEEGHKKNINRRYSILEYKHEGVRYRKEIWLINRSNETEDFFAEEFYRFYKEKG